MNIERESDYMNKKIAEQAILNHAILNTVKICKNKENDTCDGCLLSEYDCPFIDLKYDLKKEFSYE